MVQDFKSAKSAMVKLEKHIEDHKKQLTSLKKKEQDLSASLTVKNKSTFLVQGMVSASRLALEISKTSIMQGVVLQKEISTKKASLQEVLKSIVFLEQDFFVKSFAFCL